VSNLRSTIENDVKDLIALVQAGKALEAFEKYYAEDCTMQENDQPPRVGKAANRAFEQDFLAKIQAVRTYACDGVVVSGDRAYVVWRVDIDHADWGKVDMSEVAVQVWRDGQIVREKFVYG